MLLAFHVQWRGMPHLLTLRHMISSYQFLHRGRIAVLTPRRAKPQPNRAERLQIYHTACSGVHQQPILCCEIKMCQKHELVTHLTSSTPPRVDNGSETKLTCESYDRLKREDFLFAFLFLSVACHLLFLRSMSKKKNTKTYLGCSNYL